MIRELTCWPAGQLTTSTREPALRARHHPPNCQRQHARCLSLVTSRKKLSTPHAHTPGPQHRRAPSRSARCVTRRTKNQGPLATAPPAPSPCLVRTPVPRTRNRESGPTSARASRPLLCGCECAARRRRRDLEVGLVGTTACTKATNTRGSAARLRRRAHEQPLSARRSLHGRSVFTANDGIGLAVRSPGELGRELARLVALRRGSQIDFAGRPIAELGRLST